MRNVSQYSGLQQKIFFVFVYSVRIYKLSQRINSLKQKEHQKNNSTIKFLLITEYNINRFLAAD